MASGLASSIRRAISRRLGSASRKLGYVGKGMERIPSGERKSMVTPRFRTFCASEVKVRTTPLTCGCQASVATRTRIRLRLCLSGVQCAFYEKARLSAAVAKYGPLNISADLRIASGIIAAAYLNYVTALDSAGPIV